MKAYTYFSERYKELISGGDFVPEFEFVHKRYIAEIMIRFAAPMQYQPSRYDSWTSNTDALYESIEVFGKRQGWDLPSNFDYNEMLCKRDAHELFDIIEIQYEQLGSEDSEYQTEINKIFDGIDCQFRLFNGKIIKVDSRQFEQDLKKKILDRLEQLRCDEPLFQSAYEELVKALELFARGENKDAILQAAYSLESMMKILLNDPNAEHDTAGKLIEKITASSYFSEVPVGIMGVMKDKVLQSLPVIRNGCGSGHGKGTKVHEIPKSVANLALNLASALNTFLTDLYLEKHLNQPQVPKAQASCDKLPF